MNTYLKSAVVLPVLVFIILSCHVSTLYATSLWGIKLYPGSRNEPKAAEALENLIVRGASEQEFGMELASREIKSFSTPDVPDRVYQFFKKQLNAVLQVSEYNGIDIANLKPGTTTPARYAPSDFGGVIFSRERKESNGDITCFHITVTSAAHFNGISGAETIYYIIREVYSPSKKASVKSQSELGLPLYPDAVYVPTESYKMGIISYDTFVTTDALEKVISYYSSKLGKTPLKNKDANGNEAYFYQGFSKTSDSDSIIITFNNKDKQIKILYSMIKAD